MCPFFTTNNSTSNSLGNSIPFPNLFLCEVFNSVFSAKTSHFGFSKAVKNMILAACHNTPSLAIHVRNVLDVGSQEQMGGIHAVSGIAPMKDAKLFGNAPMQQLPKHAGCLSGHAKPEQSVAVAINSRFPRPTLIWAAFLHLAPKSPFKRHMPRQYSDSGKLFVIGIRSSFSGIFHRALMNHKTLMPSTGGIV